MNEELRCLFSKSNTKDVRVWHCQFSFSNLSVFLTVREHVAFHSFIHSFRAVSHDDSELGKNKNSAVFKRHGF